MMKIIIIFAVLLRCTPLTNILKILITNDMTKQILLPHSVRKELDRTFKLGRNELQRALTYTTNSGRAKMLRVAALQRGGLVYTGEHAPNGYCPDVETNFDHTNGIMRQNFGKRVVLEVKRKTNEATVIIDEQPVATFEDMTLSAWGNVLYSLQQVYNQLTQ